MMMMMMTMIMMMMMMMMMMVGKGLSCVHHLCLSAILKVSQLKYSIPSHKGLESQFVHQKMCTRSI